MEHFFQYIKTQLTLSYILKMSGIKNGSSIGLMKPLSQIKKKYQSTFQRSENDNFSNQINNLGDIVEKLNKMMDRKIGQIKNYFQDMIPAEARKQVLGLSDLEPRFTEIKFPFKSILNQDNKDKRLLQIKIFAADLARAIITKGFIWFEQNKIPDDKLRQFFCNNFIANVVRYADQNNLELEQLRVMDKHLKDNVFSFLKKRYPQNQSGEPNRKFDALVVPVDNMISNSNDLVFPSKVKFKYKQNGDYSKQIMLFINYILQITRQQTINPNNEQNKNNPSKVNAESNLKEKNKQNNQKGKPKKKEMNLTSMFFEDMENIFKKVQSQQWMIKAKSNIFQEQQQIEKIPQKQIVNQQDEKKRIEQEAKKQKYKKTVKQYTKYLIGQKISANFTKFTDKQIQEQNLTVTNAGVMRILTKWCEQLQNSFQQVNINSRDEKFRMSDGSERYISKKARRQLFEQLSEQQKAKGQFIQQIKTNIYQNQFKMLKDPNRKLFQTYRQFASQDEGVTGYFATVMKKSYDNYIISYLNKLIHCILQAQQKLQTKYTKKQYYKIAVNLITFKIGDLLRCKCSSKQAEIIALYSYLKYYCSRPNSNLQIVRVKNRLSEGTKDILINFKYYNRILVEMQLAINQETSHFIKCSDKTNHFIYQLQRATFGPIIQLCNVYAGVDPRAQFFRKKFESFDKAKKKEIQKQKSSKHSKTQCTHDNNERSNLPVWCDSCSKFISNLNLITPHLKCKNCSETMCSGCYIQKGKQQKIKDKFKIQSLKFEAIKSEDGFLKKQLKIFDLQMKKKPYTLIYIVNFNFKLVLFESLDYKAGETGKDGVENMDKIQKVQKGVVYIGQAKNQKQLDNLLKNKLIIDQKTISQQKKQQGIDENQQKLKKFMYAEIIKVMFKTIKKKYKKYFVFEEIEVEEDKVLVNETATDFQQQKKNLPSVEQININNAQLKSIKKLIATFPNARIVLIHKNKIQSLDGVQKWTRVKELNLQGNKLRQVPQSIKQLKNLTFLLLTNNKFKTFPQNLCEIKSLQTLNFKQNKFQVVSQNIKKLENLKILRLSKNKIKKVPKAIQHLQKLQQIDMSHNFITELPEELKKLQNMAKFIFEKNQLSKIQDDMFINMRLLTSIDLSNNKIRQIPGSLKDKEFLKKIQLCNNQIEIIPEFIFQLPALQDLSLSKNKIRNIKIVKAPYKEKIQGKQRKESKEGKQARYIEKLKNLQLNENIITELPNQLFELKSIEKLKLGSNQFKGEKMKNITSQIAKLTNLKFLDLQNLGLTQIPKQVLQLRKIQSLGFDNNQITGLPSQMHKISETLNDLYLKSNKLKNFPNEIFKLQSLATLGLNNNQIKNIPTDIGILKRLVKLKIQNTEIQKIPQQLLKIPTLIQLNLTRKDRKIQGKTEDIKHGFSKDDFEQMKKKARNPKFKVIDTVLQQEEDRKKKKKKQKQEQEQQRRYQEQQKQKSARVQ